jgi:hypothetical protein
MILDTILLTLAEIASTKESGVAILPEMRITLEQGAYPEAHNPYPVSGYDLQLSGNVDYAVIMYDDVKDFKSGSDCHTLSHQELIYGLLRPHACSWCIQRGCILYCRRSPVPIWGQMPES